MYSKCLEWNCSWITFTVREIKRPGLNQRTLDLA